MISLFRLIERAFCAIVIDIIRNVIAVRDTVMILFLWFAYYDLVIKLTAKLIIFAIVKHAIIAPDQRLSLPSP